ncbi:MAG TPA: hypothetical protein VMM18_05145 [Gemmatimonadaceae bacterium]|nr:hypothetical protein [Gemmatimonadaceae bacterium]
MSARPRPGATLLEAMVVVSFLAILATLSIPRAAALLDRARVTAATNEAAATFGVARHLAIRHARRSTVLIDPVPGTLTVRVGLDTVHHRPLAATHRVALRATRDSMSYHPTGVGYGAANLTLVIERGSAADTVVVSRLGRVRR